MIMFTGIFLALFMSILAILCVGLLGLLDVMFNPMTQDPTSLIDTRKAHACPLRRVRATCDRFSRDVVSNPRREWGFETFNRHDRQPSRRRHAGCMTGQFGPRSRLGGEHLASSIRSNQPGRKSEFTQRCSS